MTRFFVVQISLISFFMDNRVWEIVIEVNDDVGNKAKNIIMPNCLKKVEHPFLI
jgi:hypothetical protein